MQEKESKRPLTSTERSQKRDKRLEKFGLKKWYFRFSRSQRALVDELKAVTQVSSREAVIHDALACYAKKHGLSLSEINKRLKCQKESAKP